MDPTLIAILAVFGLVYFGIYKLCAATARRETIPLEGSEFPREDVKAALERMGCVISSAGSQQVSGLMRGTGFAWGQNVSVTHQTGALVIGSSFVRSQVRGAARNQENIDAFKREWAKRADLEVTSPEARAVLEVKTIQNAKTAVKAGKWQVGLGAALAVFGVYALTQNSGSFSAAPLMIMGSGLGLAGMGVGNLRAGKRSRE